MGAPSGHELPISVARGCRSLPEQGHGDGQAEVTIPAVIMADGARHVTIDKCEIAHTGIYESRCLRRADLDEAGAEL